MATPSDNLRKLSDFATRVAQLRRERLAPVVAEGLQGTVLKLLADQFRKEVDPYGKPWAPLKRERPRNAKARKKGRRGAQKILQNTGLLRASGSTAVIGGRISVRFPVSYATFPQSGTKHSEARKLVPDAGPSQTWNAALKRDAGALLKQLMEE
jgi:hypothetical protein